MQKKHILAGGALALTVALYGCGGGSDSSAVQEPSLTVPETYSFESRIGAASSVSYSGQVARQALIEGLKTAIGGLGNASGYTSDEVTAILDSYYTGGTVDLASEPVPFTTDPQTLQNTYGDISSNKNLEDKTAGNDTVTDHANWSGGDFAGWEGAASPEALIRDWFQTIADNAAGDNRYDPVHGTLLLEPYQTADGLDLNQLIQKFLLGAVAFSQATDDYLDDATENKGLLTDNTGPAGDSPYTALEHQWDEGYGYFGAARDYNAYQDSEIVSPGYRDSNEDAAIDLQAEYNYAWAGYAAKRDLSSTTGTDFTQTIFDAFRTGRAIISSADGALTDAEVAQLQAQRDTIVENWEKVMAANVIHYANAVLDDMDAALSDYDYGNHIKHWGEMKGFALGMQFNPRSFLTTEQFAQLHAYLGDRPVLPNRAASDVEAYRQALLSARDLLQQTYGFQQTDVENW